MSAKKKIMFDLGGCSIMSLNYELAHNVSELAKMYNTSTATVTTALNKLRNAEIERYKKANHSN